ncbi:MAG: hypothetical protein IT473_07200 [Lysobacter sp.]|nr:hypothetical protein [Lysobacter sp.]
MKKPCLIAAMCVLSASLSSIGMDAEAAGKQRTPRGELVHRIVMKWGGHVQEAYRADVGDWASAMVPVFSKASLDTLKRAANSPTFELMNDAFLVDSQGNSVHTNLLKAIDAGTTGDVSTNLLGETTNDLVFVPITPCRIVDTRVAGGAIAANTVRHFDVTAVSDYAFQGGDASNCNGAGAAGSFAAAAINFTVVTPSIAGYITAFPFLGTQPLASTVNYTAGDIRGNFAIVRLDQGASANELSVYSFGQTHLVADLVGYYINPVLGPLDCQETVSSNITVNANSTGTGSSPACATGYTIVSGGCTMSTFDGRIVSSRQFPGSNTHFCAFRNENATNANTGVAYGRCCKLPSGRAP